MMTFTKQLTTVALAALLAACGGGSEPEAITPKAAAVKLQSAAKATPRQQAVSVTAEEAAELLLAFAEANVSYLFPAASASQTMTAGPFRFRYYSETGLYLGVVVEAGTPYEQYGVYVLGGIFGLDLANPYYAGQLTNYIDVTIGTGGDDGGNNGGNTGGGSGNGCFDLALADTEGTVLDITYQYTGTITGGTRVLTTVGALTTFEGQSARANSVVTTASGGAAALAASGYIYSLREGDNMRHFGSQFSASVSAGGFTTNTAIKTVYSPSYLDTTYTLAQGQSVTLNLAGSTTTTTSITGSPFPLPDVVTGPTAFSTSATHTYVGRENITALGKTLETCKYTTTTPASNETTTTWYALPKGVAVRITTSVTPQTIEATAASVNGTPL